MKEDDYGLFVEGEIYPEICRDAGFVIDQIRNYIIQGLSIGYIVQKFKKTNIFRKARILEKIDLIEISLVTDPANKLCKIKSLPPIY